MTTQQVLRLQVKLLMKQYGRDQLMRALAEIEDVDLSKVESEVEDLRLRRRKRAKPTPRSLTDLLLAACPDDPRKRESLAELMVLYEGRSFLPELRHVRRFLELAGATGAVKSRSDAIPKLVKTLSSRSTEGIRQLVETARSGRSGDLGVIAEQIIKDRGSR